MATIKLWNKIANAGVDENQGFIEKNRIKLLNLFSLIVFCFISIYLIVNFFLENYLLVIIDVFLLATSSLVIFLNFKRQYLASKMVYFIFLNLFQTFVAIVFGRARGIEYFLLVNAVVIFIFFEKRNTLLFFFLFTLLCFYVSRIGQYYWPAVETENSNFADYFYYVNMTALFLGLFLISYYFQNRLIRNQKLIINQNIELRHLNHAKGRLLSIISHDFKSPLNSLHGLLNLVKNQELTIEEAKSLFNELDTQLGHTQNLLDNLLDWAKLQFQGEKEPFQQVNLKELADESMELLGGQKIKKIRFVNHIDRSLNIMAEVGMLKMVIRNLFSNAVKFSHPGGEVSIDAAILEKYIEISIRDQGVGIDKANQQKLFDLDTNLSTYGTANEKGTGIGLILCKELINRAGGEIRLEAEAGKGTSVLFTIPNMTAEIA